MVWTISPRPGQTAPQGEPEKFIPKAKVGAPSGVAPLDGSAKIPITHMRMAPETAARFTQLEQMIAARPPGGGALQVGSGLTRVGDELRLAIDQLPKG